MDFAQQEKLYQQEMARRAMANQLTSQSVKKQAGIDPRAWISEATGIAGGIGGGLLGTLVGMPHLGAGIGAAAGSAIGKTVEQKVKGEAIKPRDVITESALSGLLSFGPLRAGKVVTGIGKSAAATTATGAVKGAFSKTQREGIDFLGRAWGLHSGNKIISSGNVIGLERANALQNFAKKIGAKKTFAAIDLQDIAEQYSKTTGNAIKARLTNSKLVFDTNALVKNLESTLTKVYGTGGKRTTLIKEITRDVKATKGNYSKLWDVRKKIDRQLINFNKGTDLAATTSQSISNEARKILNTELKKVKDIKNLFKDYNDVSDILTLVAKEVKSPKGSVIPGTGLRVLGKSTQRGQALIGTTLKKLSGDTTEEKASKSLLSLARGQAARQGVATGIRQAITTPEAQQISTTQPTTAVPTTGVTGMAGGALTTAAPQVDKRLNVIRQALVQDYAKTKGKNVDGIIKVARAYGVDLTPLGIKSEIPEAKTGFAALTADQQKRVANLNTVSAALNALEQDVSQSGFFPEEPQALSALLGIPRRTVGQAINPAQRQYMATLRSRGIQIIRALGEVGNLSQSEQDAAIRILPQPGDNAQTAALKIQELRTLFADVAQRVASPQIGTFQ